MKTRIYIYIALISLFLASSCAEGPGYISEPCLEDGCVTINLFCNGPTTKATMDGDPDYNENTLTTIDYYLYPEGATNQNALVHSRVTMYGRTSFNVPAGSFLASLFAGAAVGNKCDVYIIANYPGSHPSSSTDTTSLRALTVTTNFKDVIAPTDFVMTGSGKATVISKNKMRAAEASINLYRTAAKITFECTISPVVPITNNIYDANSGEIIGTQTVEWVPMLTITEGSGGAGVYLVNGYKNSHISGDPTDFRDEYNFKYSQRSLTDDDNDGYYSCDPFYSYPQEWHSGEEREPFLKLVVPWAKRDPQNPGQTKGQKQFYYKVPCPDLKMESNTWYHIKLNVAILGGDDFEAAMDITGEYYVLPWNTQTEVLADAEIKEARYISAPAQEYTMYNTNRLDFSITSSHDDTFNLISVTYQDFKKGEQTLTSKAKTEKWITYDDDTRTVTIDHSLNNDLSSTDFDSSPYVFTFEIHHTDDASYSTGNIVVTQYPAMYIEEETSDLYAFVNTYGNGTGTAYDNSNPRQSLANVTARGNVDGSGDNKNPHLYRVHVTSVSGLNYTIGDPRLWSTPITINLTGLGDNYMATAEINEDMIAPVFMVASSVGAFSTNTPLSYELCATRCAAYQESGYPAGRWRIPTKAEILFMITLSENGKIPSLFLPDSDVSKGGYWCSSGVVYPLTSGTIEYLNFTDAARYNNNKNWVRCIYDSWDWGNDPPYTGNDTQSWQGYHTH